MDWTDHITSLVDMIHTFHKQKICPFDRAANIGASRLNTRSYRIASH